jgi:hypothetical protein
MDITNRDTGKGKGYYQGLSYRAVTEVLNQDLKIGDLVSFAKAGRGNDYVTLGVVSSIGGNYVGFKSIASGVTMSRHISSVTLIPNGAERIQQFKLDNPELFI